MIYQNFSRRITAATVQVLHADKKGVSNTAKSSYYRAATILLCTIIEGLTYQLVKKHIGRPPYVIDTKNEYIVKQKISTDISKTGKSFIICEKISKNINIDDNHVGFGRLNVYLKNKGIISEKQFTKLDYIRKERNKLHVQGLTVKDIGYTKKKINSISLALDFLIAKL